MTRRSSRVSSTSTTSATPSFIVTASGCAPPMPPAPPVSVSVPASEPPNRLAGHRTERLVRALQDALRADVDPRAGGHLAVHRQALGLELAELGPGRPVADQVGVGDQHARRPLVRAEHADRLARLHQQRLVVGERLEGADDRVVRLPAAGRLAGAAVDDEVFGALGHLGIEVVHQHAHRRLGLPGLRGDGGAAGSADGGTVHFGVLSTGSRNGVGGFEEGARAYELGGGLEVG